MARESGSALQLAHQAVVAADQARKNAYQLRETLFAQAHNQGWSAQQIADHVGVKVGLVNHILTDHDKHAPW